MNIHVSCRPTLSLIFLLSILVAGCDTREAAPPEPELQSIKVITIAPQALSPAITFNSRLIPLETAKVVARVKGQVVARRVEGGEPVKKGDVLIEIDPEVYDLAVQQETAAFTAAQASFNEAKRNLTRGETLLQKGVIAAAEMDRLRAAYERAEAALEQSDARLDRAQIDLGYTRVRSPIDGMVGLVNVSIGDTVGPENGPLLTVSAQDVMLADVEVGEVMTLDAIRREAAGEEIDYDIHLILADGQPYEHPGSIFSVASLADPTSSTSTVRLKFDNPDGILVAGQSVKITARESEPRDVLAVPTTSLQLGQIGNYVLVVDAQDTVQEKVVELGPIVDDLQIVQSGLEAGDRVITEGLQKVRAGQKVAVTE